MKRFLFGFILTLATAASALGAEPPREGDIARLQGRWTAKAGPQGNIQVLLEIEGQQARIDIATPQGLKFQVQGELRINDRVIPRTLDWVKFTGLDEQSLPDIPAIYELDGQTFKVCNGGPNSTRPKEFKPGEGILAGIVVFERPKSKEASATPPRAPDASTTE
jgi:uncharacterized protein (TIGR03067 family)